MIGSRDTLRLAFRVGLIRDTSHTDNRSTAEQVSQQVGSRYLPCFQELRQVLSARIKATGGEGSDG